MSAYLFMQLTRMKNGVRTDEHWQKRMGPFGKAGSGEIHKEQISESGEKGKDAKDI